ncbi:MAG TPA: 3-methyladenine DNA glycosylase, partial [Jiangellaceae bacterium]|nr:3-methyladenine DNA glycosylase [Jiangellaceae bacterium]
LYKWAYKLSPLIPSELVADAFVLAREIRELDMRASPYDLSMLGYEPVAIETAAGRREYTSAQRAFSEQAAKLRRRLLAAIAPLTAHVAFRDGCVLP